MNQDAKNGTGKAAEQDPGAGTKTTKGREPSAQDGAESAPDPVPPEQGAATEPAAEPAPETAHPWDAHLSSYPLRDASEDPKWAVRTVWGWTWFALFNLAFLLVLFVLGFFYD